GNGDGEGVVAQRTGKLGAPHVLGGVSGCPAVVFAVCGFGGDRSFTVTITREYMLINGFEEDATLTAVETWADKQTALGGTAE
ncbi:hypothetical protein J5991_00100, partial [Methanocorpusculum sp.]|nr:hypothetical protein [Methanocorpusculum sp.]